MKRYIYKLLPLILIFVFTFSSVAMAEETAQTPLYECPVYDEWYQRIIDYAIELYYADTGSSEQIFVYAATVAVDSSSVHRANVYIAPRSAAPGNGANPTIFTYSGGIKVYYVTGYEDGHFSLNSTSTIQSIGLSNNVSVKIKTIYVSQDIYDDVGQLYYQSPNPLYPVIEEPEKPKNEFDFDILNDFQDFTEQSSEYNNVSQKQQVTQNDNNPNDEIFQNILQAISGNIHTGNSITQQISNQVQNFVEQFFNNFAQYSLGLMNSILGTLNDFTGKFDGLLDMANQLYSSGIGSNGEFGLGNMFSYWLVPSDEFIDSQYNMLVGALPFIDEIQGISDTLLNLFQTVESKSPTITIHAGTYGFIVLTDDCVIGFDWFLDWKPYTDIFIAVFVYAGLALHLVRQLPGILGGTSSVVNSASGLDKPQKGGKGS